MSIYQFKVKDIFGKIKNMSDYKNNVLLIVNVASKCGFTKQYEELENLYKKYQNKNFKILGFPCNQFFMQEPKSENEILSFCKTKYDVSFDMFSKIKVNGEDACDLYKYLKEQKPWTQRAKAVKWNFEKFLIDKNGNVVNRFLSKVTPLEIEKDIVELLE